MLDPTRSEERWKPVPSYEGLYEASDLGRVRSIDRVVIRKDGRLSPRSGRVLRPSLTRGYAMVMLSKNNERAFRWVHGLVLQAFVGPRPAGAECCHNDGDPLNNQLENLRWDTRSENMNDKVRHGTHQQTRKTRCPRGHLLEAPNLTAAHAARGRRLCRACNSARGHEGRAKGRGQTIDFEAVADAYYKKFMGTA